MPLPDPRRLANDKGSEDARNGQRDFYCPVSVYRATAFDGSDGNEWPFWPLYLESMTSTELLSIAGTGVYIAPMLGVMLTSTFWGRVGDKTGNKVMMIRALMGLALTQLGLAFANEVWLVLILRFCRVPVRVILRRLRPMVLQWCQRHSVRDFLPGYRCQPTQALWQGRLSGSHSRSTEFLLDKRQRIYYLYAVCTDCSFHITC